MKTMLRIRHTLAMGLLAATQAAMAAPRVGQLETVAELPMRPGDVSATAAGRVFATVHPLGKPSGLQLIEITGRKSFRPWPSAELQSDASTRGDERLDAPLGITQDAKGRLWVTDMGLNIGKTRLWAFDIASGKEVKRITLPATAAPKGSFVQDLVVDSEAGWAYLADAKNLALLAVRIDDGHVRRFQGHPSLLATADAELHVGGKPTQFAGAPARGGVNPLTLSADGKTLYFGAMVGTRWYSVPTQLLREGPDDQVAAAIVEVGRKPVSDGAATDSAGNHFFTNLNENGIDTLDTQGKLRPLVRNRLLEWPDGVQFGPSSWLYISVNQLHKTPLFNGGKDDGKPPYRLMRVWTGTPGVAWR